MCKKIYIIIFTIGFVFAGKAYGQFASPLFGTYGPYLSSKIEIQYLQTPNAKPVSIASLVSDLISRMGSVSLFGTNGNNGMDKSAELVDALFKSNLITPAKSISKSSADVKFQQTVFQALQLKKGQKIRICFINDNGGITDDYLKEYKFYYKEVPGFDYKFVWPGIFNDPSFGATIVLGESFQSLLSLETRKKVLLSLIVQLCLEDYGPAKGSIDFFDFQPGDGPEKVVFATSDRRRIENQAIADAFLLYYNDKYKSDAFEWVVSGSNILLPKSEVNSVATSDEGALVPLQRYSLRDKFIGINTADAGSELPTSFLPKTFTDNWVYYNSFEFKGDKSHPYNYHNFQSDVFLGIFFYQFIRAFGIEKFIDAIAYDNNKLLSTKPGLKTAFLLQSMCLLMMGDKNVQYLKDNPGSTEAKNAVFPLAMFSYMGGLTFASADAAAYKKSMQVVTDAAAIQSRGSFDDLVALYIADWQKKIKTAFLADTPADNEDGYILSKCARVARIVGIN